MKNVSLFTTTEKVMLLLQQKLRHSLAAQGHVNTGRLRDSIRYEVAEDGNSLVATMYMEDYGMVVEFGVSAQNIPYGGNGGGGTSQYIQGLISFFENKGLSGRDAIGAAFATANVHKREGMPTRASSRFSSTGRRTGFVRETLADNLDNVRLMFARDFAADVQIEMFKEIDNLDHVSVA